MSLENGEVKKLPVIVQAIQDSVRGTHANIVVHISRRPLEKNVLRAARAVFRMHKLDSEKAVLIYINRRTRKFAILSTNETVTRTGVDYFKKLASFLEEDLHATWFDNAVSMTVRSLGETLKKHFPAI